VNLLPTDGVQQFLQVNVTLKVKSQAAADAVKGRMPEVRSGVLMLLSGKRANELLSTPGKEKLALEVGDAVRKVVDPKNAAKAEAPADTQPAAAPADGGAEAQPARPFEVLFTGFIIQ
jgi:flagellar FliL protein